MRNYSCKYPSIRAIQWNGKNGEDVIVFCGEDLESFVESGKEGNEADCAIARFTKYSTGLLIVNDFIIDTRSENPIHRFKRIGCWNFEDLYNRSGEADNEPVPTQA